MPGTGRFNNIITIDIETEEAHRYKRLGLTLQKLAQKVGFKLIKQSEVYWFDINNDKC